jgi:UDP:flavonoid glycosyltransferase YjiC (YdhE family)
MMDAAQPVLWQAADDYWAACQGADLILYPILAALPARDIAEKLGIPAYPAYLQHVHSTGVYPSGMMPALPRLGAPYHRMTYALSSELFWRAMRPIMSEWRQDRLGLPALPRRNIFPAWERARTPCFYGFSPAVIPRAPEWGDHIHITGYWFLHPWTNPVAPAQVPAGHARLADFLASGPPPVFVGFGSMSERDPARAARLVIRALALSRQRGVLLTGWSGLQPGDLRPGDLRPGDLPDEIVAIESAPFEWLFPQMAAVVHHGGAGTTAAGLAAGRPTVVVPFFGDQHFWAWRVAALGVGPQPIRRRQLSAEHLAAAITEAITDSTIRARAAALGEQIRREDGVGTFVALLQDLMRGEMEPQAASR